MRGGLPERLARLEARARPGRWPPGGQRAPGRAARRPALPLRLVRRRLADRGDGVHRDRARPRLPRAHRPLAAAHGRPRPERRAAGPPARRRRRGQRAPRRQLHGCSRASRSTSSTTARSTRPTRCSRRLDVRVASVHSKLAMERRAMTRRMVGRGPQPAHQRARPLHRPAGHRQPRHPQPAASSTRGRCSRPASENDVAVEINSRPERRDPPDQAARAGPRHRLPVLDRQRRPRARASSTSSPTAASGPRRPASSPTGSSTPGRVDRLLGWANG